MCTCTCLHDALWLRQSDVRLQVQVASEGVVQDLDSGQARVHVELCPSKVVLHCGGEEPALHSLHGTKIVVEIQQLLGRREEQSRGRERVSMGVLGQVMDAGSASNTKAIANWYAIQ